MRGLDRAVLATALDAKAGAAPGTPPGSEAGGWPYASLVLVALTHAAAPLLLISDLAEHTRNIKADPRVSLLFDGTAGLVDPLTGARVTLTGRARRLPEGHERDRAVARFTARHPSAAMYAGFKDFHLYAVDPERAHLVAGFGRIHWAERGDILLDVSEAGALAEAEADVVAHMNEDHADAIGLYATRLLGATAGDWRMTGVDPEGADLRAGGAVLRLPFDKRADDAEAARVELVRLVKRARGQAG
ncbi:MAG: DUF2470 domain-containing protein [Alphaproteobacteria bacterium]|nr:DUF2470 domain-containing protein [Alphaproteobacteria bacterium]